MLVWWKARGGMVRIRGGGGGGGGELREMEEKNVSNTKTGLYGTSRLLVPPTPPR